MLTRALIVLLTVLNIGVAAWWIWRPQPPTPTLDDDLPSGIARLQLVQSPDQPERVANERSDPQRDTPGPATVVAENAAPPAAETPADATTATVPETATAVALSSARCFRIGPYPDELARTAALPALRPYASDISSPQTRGTSGRGWRVLVPPAADAEAAKAMAERIRAAGFNDNFVMTGGAEANAIALGRFSSEDRARQHAASLVTAGFPARAEALGDTRPQYWIDIVAVADADLAALRRAAGGPEVRTADCPSGG